MFHIHSCKGCKDWKANTVQDYNISCWKVLNYPINFFDYRRIFIGAFFKKLNIFFCKISFCIQVKYVFTCFYCIICNFFNKSSFSGSGISKDLKNIVAYIIISCQESWKSQSAWAQRIQIQGIPAQKKKL